MSSEFKIGRRVFLGSTAALAATPMVGRAATANDYPDVERLRIAHAAQGIIRPNKTYRMMEWECHTPPSGNFNIDIETALKRARDAGAESVMFYSQDHWGYSFFPTNVGVRHPHLTYDLFGREVEISRRLGMSPVCYFSLQFNNQCVLSHPDWGWINEASEQQRMRWYITCLDSPYRSYVLGVLQELFSRYEIDELFLDIFGIQFHIFHSTGKSPFCFCKYTEEAWDKEHPGDPYRAGFANPAGWEKRYQWHEKRTMTDMLDEIIAVARKHRPDVMVSLNGGPEAFPNDVMQKVSFIYAEPLTSATGISLGSILMRGWGRPDFQAGVFSQQGYLDTYPGGLPRVKADALILQNARVFFVGNAPVIGDLDGHGFSRRWFDVAKETFEDVRNVDVLLDGIEPVYSTAVLYSEATREQLAIQKRPQAFRHSVLSALELATFSGRPVESLPEFRMNPATLAGFETVILPETEVLSSELAETLRNWVRNGGTLIASGRCGLLDEKRNPRKNFVLADVFGANYVEEERKYAYDPEGKFKEGVIQTYLESSGHSLAKTLSESTVGLSGAFLRLEKRSGAEEVMHYRLPFMVEDVPHNKWFNWGPPPPGTETGGPAVIYNRFGKGQSLYIGAPIFQEMSEKLFWTQKWIPRIMRQLVPNAIVELTSSKLSHHLHGTFFWDKSKKFILVQLLNSIELSAQAEFIDVPKVDISWNPARLKLAGARMVWPRSENYIVKTVARRGTLRIPSPGRYAAIYLKLS
jgi:hypothetical protein